MTQTLTDTEKAEAVLEMLACRKWEFIDQTGRYVVTDREILHIYYEYWEAQMYRALRQDEVNTEACIQDFVTVHFARQIQ